MEDQFVSFMKASGGQVLSDSAASTSLKTCFGRNCFVERCIHAEVVMNMDDLRPQDGSVNGVLAAIFSDKQLKPLKLLVQRLRRQQSYVHR